MMSRKQWIKVVTALEMLPLVAATSLYADNIESPPEESAATADAAAPVDAAPAVTVTAKSVRVNKAGTSKPATPAPAKPQEQAKAAASQTTAAPAQVQPKEPSTATATAATAATVPAQVQLQEQAKEMVAASSAASTPFELSFAQANQEATRGMTVEAIHVDPNDPKSPIRTVALRAKMYNACAPHFTIKNTAVDPEVRTKDAVGFKIIDDGQGLACVKEQRKLHENCTPTICGTLTALFEGATMDLVNFNQDGAIKLIHESANTTAILADNIGNEPLKFESADTLRKKVEEELRAEEKARNDANEEKFKNCRHSLQELAVATRALNTLIRDINMTADEIKSRRDELKKAKEELAKKQMLARFKELEKQVAKVKDRDEAESLSDDIASFADAYSEMAKKCRKLQQDLIAHVADNFDDVEESFDTRKAIYERLIGMEGVSASEARVYRLKMNGLEIAKKAALFQSGSFENVTWAGFQSDMRKFAEKSDKDYKTSCRNTKSNALSEACLQAMSNSYAVKQLGTLGTTAIQQKAVEQQQEFYRQQMSLQQYMTGTLGAGVPGIQSQYALGNPMLGGRSF
jgi:hypothetical protein